MDLDAEIASSLASFLPKNAREEIGKKKKLKLPPNLEEEKKGKSETSVIGLQTNQAATRLLERTGQKNIASRQNIVNRQEQIARQTVKEEKAEAAKERKQKTKKREREETEKAPNVVLPPAALESVQLPEQMPPTLHIQNMEQHNRRAREVELFAAQIERPDRPTTDMIIQTPTMQETLAHCNRFQESRVFVDQYMQTYANQRSLTLQKMPVFSRQMLQPFLRERNPHAHYERDCCNLDREPVQGEQRMRCVAHRLSEERTGRAYRLRELLFPEQIVAINHTLEVEGGDPTRHLYPVPEMCYLCHIFLTNQMALEQKNKAQERERKDLTSSSSIVPMIAILNRFMVTFGTEGEYDLRRLLVSDNVAMGILGPFPLWSERHYQECIVQPSGLRGFAEKDILVFRLSREPSELIESQVTSGSTRSTPTFAKRGTTTFRK